ncbi:Ig-like domain-containing protein, partial [Legionella lansingensis]
QRLPANGSLTETFTVKTVDGTNQNVVITIKGTNDLPIATADVVSLNAAQSVSGNLFSNDRDVDIGDQLNLAWINNSNNSTSIGAWGQLTWEPDGSFTYTVNPDATAYLGAGKSVSETFEYAVSDQYGGLTTSTLTISNIVGVNDNPVATASVLRLGEGQNILGQLYATDADSNHGMDSLSFNVVTGTAHGQLILNTDGSFSYTANPGYYGTDSFTYKVIDPLGGTSNTATVAINIHERRFEFTPANEALVNTTTNSNQSDPVVTALSGGGYVVAWEGRGASDTTGVYGQIYNDAGSKIGSEFRINSSTSGNQQNVSVATTSSGFIATWDSASGALDSSGTGVYARVFNSNGVGGSEFRINQSTSGNQQNSQVIVLDDGKIAVVWESVESGAPNIYARFFNSSGTALTNEIRINTNLSNNQQRPSISQVGDKVVITWEDNANSSNGYDIKAQLISIDSSSLGGFIGSNFIVNTIVGSNQNNPEVTVLENGNFVVTYESTVGSSKEIYLKQFDADGVAVGVETRINTTTTGNQDNVAVTALRSGGYMVVWSSVESGSDKYGVFAQEFNADGSKAGDEFRINVHNANDQNLPTLTELTDGSIVIAWQSQNQAAGWDIYHSLLKDMAQGGMFMEGSSSNDTLRGTESSDIISGGAGDDILIGGGAADYLSGGTGMDTADYSYSLAGVKVNLSSGSNTGGDATGDILSGIENIRGSKYADILEGNSGYNTLWGGEGNDQLIGGAGDDVLLGGSGSNILSGGTGVDTASYEDSASGVTVNLTTGTSSMGDSLQDVENIKGSSFGDTLIGDRSDNILEGGAGEDSLLGGEGSDTASYTGSTMGVSVNLSTGIGSGGEAHGDTFTSIENITGSKYSDTLLGDTNANTLSGGAGNDTLMGGAGNDLFTFGLNSDSDVLYGGTDTQDGGSWVDTVQLTDATTGPANSIEARGDWLLQTEATYTIVDKAVTFTEGNASGTITLADGSMATFTDIDQIRWS